MVRTTKQLAELVERARQGTGCLHHAHLKTAARLHGASLACESSGKWCVWQVEAPKGKAWACASVQALRVEWLRGDRKYEDQAIRDAIERMSCGLHDVEQDEDEEEA